jgi:ABC-type uncharacterized transport system ATPase subunit
MRQRILGISAWRFSRKQSGCFATSRLKCGADPQQVLAALMGWGNVVHFEVARPSLHDIFVRIASPKGEEAQHA